MYQGPEKILTLLTLAGARIQHYTFYWQVLVLLQQLYLLQLNHLVALYKLDNLFDCYLQKFFHHVLIFSLAIKRLTRVPPAAAKHAL